jgi:hypothetical protein
VEASVDDNRAARESASLVVIGAICGLAWAAGLRAFMAELVGFASRFDWVGTFGVILLPGALTGGLLGWAESLRRAGGAPHWRWLALAPLVLAVVPLVRPGAFIELVTTGIGGAAVGVALIGIGGGYAISGRGRLWGRIVAGVLIGASLAATAFTPAAIGGEMLTLTEPRGAWVAVLGVSFLLVLVLASSIPFRRVLPQSAE